jgi:hypothetical protein
MRLHEISYNVYNDTLYQQYKTAIDFAVNKYVTSGAAMYKGSLRYGKTEGLLIRDPMSYPEPRRSANTMNYYTEWVANSAKWAQFPKRNRSLICTTNRSYAEGYGDTRVVVPVADTTIGVCPDNDWWNSFQKTSSMNNPDDINRFVHEVLKDNDIFLNGNKVTYSEFAPYFKSIDLEKHDPSSYTQDLKDLAIKLGGLDKLMDYIFDPVANGFSLTTWKQFNIKGNNEVWLSVPCVMIPMSIWGQLVNS